MSLGGKLTGAARKPRMAYLDGMRAVAVLAVVAVHWLPSYMPDSLPLFKGGYVGVDLFLVLSGFLITRILWKSQRDRIGAAYRKFIKRRFWRLYPALLGMLVAVTALVFVLGNPTDGVTATWRALIASVQLTPIVTALQLDSMLPFEHTWTLGWEWAFYLIWPIVLLAVRNRGVTAKRVAVVSAAVAVVFWIASLMFLSTDLIYNGPLGRFSQLLIGSAIGLAFIIRPEPLRLSNAARTWLMGTSLAAVVGWTVFGPHLDHPLYGYLGFPIVTLAAATMIAAGYRREDAAVPRLLAWKPLERIGAWSYSIYLWHLAPLRLLDSSFLGLPMPVIALLGVAMTCVLVTLSYQFLEKPFLSDRKSETETRAALQDALSR